MEIIYESSHISMWLEKDIIHCLFKKNSFITLEEARKMVCQRLEFQKGKKHKAVQFVSDYEVVTREAKQFLAREGFNGIEKVAIVVDTPLKAIFGNLWIEINKPPGPTRLFKNTIAAMKWLNQET